MMKRCWPESQGKRLLQISPWPKCVGSRQRVRRKAVMPSAWRNDNQRARSERCVCTTPFGCPVVPEVKRISASSSSPTSEPGGSAVLSASASASLASMLLTPIAANAGASAASGVPRHSAQRGRRRARAYRSRMRSGACRSESRRRRDSTPRRGRRRTPVCCRSRERRGRRASFRAARKSRRAGDGACARRRDPSDAPSSARSAVRAPDPRTYLPRCSRSAACKLTASPRRKKPTRIARRHAQDCTEKKLDWDRANPNPSSSIRGIRCNRSVKSCKS